MEKKIICITAACSKMGKTTFLEKLIRVFSRRGIRVGVIKSDAHGFSIDVPKKDSWRLSQAGASATAIVGPDRFALIQNTEEKKSIDYIASLLENVDIILVEGFKNAGKPQIEIIRAAKGKVVTAKKENLIAVVTDIETLTPTVPCFGLNNAAGVADLITRLYLDRPGAKARRSKEK